MFIVSRGVVVADVVVILGVLTTINSMGNKTCSNRLKWVTRTIKFQLLWLIFKPFFLYVGKHAYMLFVPSQHRNTIAACMLYVRYLLLLLYCKPWYLGCDDDDDGAATKTRSAKWNWKHEQDSKMIFHNRHTNMHVYVDRVHSCTQLDFFRTYTNTFIS